MTCKKDNTNFGIQLGLHVFVDMTISEPSVLDINTDLLHYAICLR